MLIVIFKTIPEDFLMEKYPEHAEHWENTDWLLEDLFEPFGYKGSICLTGQDYHEMYVEVGKVKPTSSIEEWTCVHQKFKEIYTFLKENHFEPVDKVCEYDRWL